jgi:hypothetical protein
MDLSLYLNSIKGAIILTFMRVVFMFALCWNQAAAFGALLFFREFAPSRSFIRSSTRVRAIWGMTQSNDMCGAACSGMCSANPVPEQGGAHHLNAVVSETKQPEAANFAGKAKESMSCALTYVLPSSTHLHRIDMLTHCSIC